MPVDFSPLYAPVPESPTSRGLTSVGTALDAVLARRQQREMMEQQSEDRRLAREMTDSRVRYGVDVNAQTQTQNRNERATEFGSRQVDRADAQDVREDNSLSFQSQLVDKLEGSGSPEFAEEVAKLNAMRERIARRRGQRQYGPPGGASSGQQQQQQQQPPPPPPPPPQEQKPVPSEIPGVAAGQIEAMPWAQQPPMQEPPTPDVVPPPLRSQTPLDAVVQGRSRLVADEWKNKQYATSPSPGVKRVVEEMAGSIALRGRGYVDEADRQVNAQRQREQEAALAASRLEEARTREGNRDGRRDLADEVKWDGLVKNVLNQFGWKEEQKQRVAAGDLSLLSKGATVSPAFTALLRGRWAKYAQGAGVLTDHDLNTFYNRMGDIADRLNTNVTELFGGTLDPEKAAMIGDAIDQLKGAADQRQRDFGRKLANYLSSYGEEGIARIPRFLGLYAEDFLPSWQEFRAKREAGKGATAAPKAPSAPRPVPKAAPRAAPPPAADAGDDTDAEIKAMKAELQRLTPSKARK